MSFFPCLCWYLQVDGHGDLEVELPSPEVFPGATEGLVAIYQCRQQRQTLPQCWKASRGSMHHRWFRGKKQIRHVRVIGLIEDPRAIVKKRQGSVHVQIRCGLRQYRSTYKTERYRGQLLIRRTKVRSEQRCKVARLCSRRAR